MIAQKKEIVLAKVQHPSVKTRLEANPSPTGQGRSAAPELHRLSIIAQFSKSATEYVPAILPAGGKLLSQTMFQGKTYQFSAAIGAGFTE